MDLILMKLKIVFIAILARFPFVNTISEGNEEKVFIIWTPLLPDAIGADSGRGLPALGRLKTAATKPIRIKTQRAGKTG